MNYLVRSLRFLSFLFVCNFLSLSAWSNINRPLKILIAENYFPPTTSTAALNQIIQLVRDGHIVHIYSRNEGSMEWAHPEIQKYGLMRLVVDRPTLKELSSYDIIYCMFGNRARQIINIIGDHTLPNTKVVTCIRGADITKNVQARSKDYYRELFAQGDLFLPVCGYFQHLLQRLGCKRDKVVVLPSTVDCSFFAYRERIPSLGKKIKIVSVSRLTKKKGLEYAIKAVAELVKTYPQIVYKIAGFGDLEPKLQKLIISLKMENNIKLVGRLSQEGVRDLLNESHIFLLPSITDQTGDQEGIPNALKEAMAVGLPVVSTYHAGIPELISDGVTGFLVREKDAKALAEKIEYLILHTFKWSSLCRAARRTIESRYERNVVNKRLTPLLYSLVNGMKDKNTKYKKKSKKVS